MSNISIDLDGTVDDDFFDSLKGIKSSKLQQLFVEDALSSDDKQQSLKYQGPKDTATPCNVASTTLIAKVVTAYKQGELLGKVGLALIQNPDDSCNIIMYKTKVIILVTLKLQPGKNLLYKQTKYWQFYDEASIYWCFSFDNPADEENFLEKLFEKSITFTEKSLNREDSEEKSFLFAERRGKGEAHEDKSNIFEHKTKNGKFLDNVQFRNLSEAQSIENDEYESKITTKETQNSLVKRMAKMGKPLPILSSNQQTTTEFSDSSDTEVIKTSFASIQKPVITPRSHKLISNKSNQQLVSPIVGLSSIASSVYPINPLESQYMQMLLTEQRTQGVEIRMNMNKLENQIEKVLDKIEYYNRNDGIRKTDKDDEILELEEKLLMLKKENRKLKHNILQSSSEESKEDEVKDVIYDFKEDLKLFDINYKQGLKNVLFELNSKLKEKYNRVQEMQQRIDKNQLEFEKLTSELEFTSNKNNELKKEISSLYEKENELKNRLVEKEAEVLKQNQELIDLQNKLQRQNQETLGNTNHALVKSIMNNLYLDIAAKLNNANILQSEQILPIIASSIKQQTLKTLQQSVPKDCLDGL